MNFDIVRLVISLSLNKGAPNYNILQRPLMFDGTCNSSQTNTDCRNIHIHQLLHFVCGLFQTYFKLSVEEKIDLAYQQQTRNRFAAVRRV